MFKNIVIRELMDHLKSLRLLITFLLLIVLMAVSSVLFLQEYQQQMRDFSRNTAETRDINSKNVTRPAALFNLFSYNWQGPFVYKSPNRLAFISEGQEKNLPNSFSPSAFKIYGPYKKLRSNVFLDYFASLDWALIFGVVLSFAAIILVYDSICGEKEKGTLRLAIANSVPRSTLLLGKFLGGFIALAVPVILGTLIQLLVLILGGTGFQSADWIRVMLSLVFIFLYLSCYLMIGLFISSRSNNSSTSLVAGLLVWAMFVVVIPGVSGMIASDMVKLPSREVALENAWSHWSDVIRKYNQENPETTGASGHWSPGEPLERAILAADAWSEVMNDFRNRQIEQVSAARRVTFISPTAVFRSGLETMAESGIYHYLKFYKQVVDFGLTQRQFLLDHYPLASRWFFPFGKNPSPEDIDNYSALSRIKISMDEVPQFQEKRLSLNENFYASLPYFALLFMFCIVFYVAAHISFQKYDVR